MLSSESIPCIATLEEAQERTLRSCEWSPDASMIASASFDGSVAVWETQNETKRTWDQVATLEGHDNEVKSVSWSSDGNFLGTCGRDKKIWIWEKLDGGEFDCVTILEGHTQDVKFIKFHPTELILFSASYDDTIRIWKEDNDDWYCVDTLSGHASTVWGLTLNERGNRVLSSSDDCSIMLWESEDDRGLEKFRCIGSAKEVHEFAIYSVDWSHHSGYIACGSGDNEVSIHAVGNGMDKSLLSCECKAIAHESDVNCVRWNPKAEFSDLLATAGDDGLVKIWKFTV
jgi:WD40 repeat protein